MKPLFWSKLAPFHAKGTIWMDAKPSEAPELNPAE
jgi:hypothetical protein